MRPSPQSLSRASAMTSYLSIRYAKMAMLGYRLEQIADMIFLCGLIDITIVATLFEVI
jgi:hypothetical protein